MTSRLRWGVLGPGGIAAPMVEDLQRVGFPVVAVGSRSLDRATEFADRHGIPNRHGSYEELVADPEVDVVYVATPQTLHAEHAVLALRAGKHLLLEKPFTITAAEARTVVATAQENGVLVLEAMWTRFLPHMRRIRELISSGAIGELRSLVATHEQSIPVDVGHRLFDPALGGGSLLDIGIYPVSFAWDLFGAPTTTHAIATLTESGLDLRTSVLYGYASGAHAVLHSSIDTAGPDRATIRGSAGRIEIDDIWYCPTTATVFDAHDEMIERIDIPVEGRGMQFQALELERLVTTGEAASELLSPQESVAIMESLDEIRRQTGIRYAGE